MTNTSNKKQRFTLEYGIAETWNGEGYGFYQAPIKERFEGILEQAIKKLENSMQDGDCGRVVDEDENILHECYLNIKEDENGESTGGFTGRNYQV